VEAPVYKLGVTCDGAVDARLRSVQRDEA